MIILWERHSGAGAAGQGVSRVLRLGQDVAIHRHPHPAVLNRWLRARMLHREVGATGGRGASPASPVSIRISGRPENSRAARGSGVPVIWRTPARSSAGGTASRPLRRSVTGANPPSNRSFAASTGESPTTRGGDPPRSMNMGKCRAILAPCFLCLVPAMSQDRITGKCRRRGPCLLLKLTIKL